MVEVKFRLGKRDSIWIGLIVVLFFVGFGYAYGGSNPSIMGHSAGEINTGCAAGEFLDGVGDCIGATYSSGTLGGACPRTGGGPIWPATACSTYYTTEGVSACASGWSVLQLDLWIGITNGDGYVNICIKD